MAKPGISADEAKNPATRSLDTHKDAERDAVAAEAEPDAAQASVVTAAPATAATENGHTASAASEDEQAAHDVDEIAGTEELAVEKSHKSPRGRKGGGSKRKLPRPEGSLPCPRPGCSSMDTKFCYYNNYNVRQPRYFCRTCQRYWTAGGTLRDVAPGSGRRRNKGGGRMVLRAGTAAAEAEPDPTSSKPSPAHSAQEAALPAELVPAAAPAAALAALPAVPLPGMLLDPSFGGPALAFTLQGALALPHGSQALVPPLHFPGMLPPQLPTSDLALRPVDSGQEGSDDRGNGGAPSATNGASHALQKRSGLEAPADGAVGGRRMRQRSDKGCTTSAQPALQQQQEQQQQEQQEQQQEQQEQEEEQQQQATSAGPPVGTAVQVPPPGFFPPWMMMAAPGAMPAMPPWMMVPPGLDPQAAAALQAQQAAIAAAAAAAAGMMPPGPFPWPLFGGPGWPTAPLPPMPMGMAGSLMPPPVMGAPPPLPEASGGGSADPLMHHHSQSAAPSFAAMVPMAGSAMGTMLPPWPSMMMFPPPMVPTAATGGDAGGAGGEG